MPPAPTAPPTSVSVSEVTPSSITVQWGPVDCIHRNGDIAGYSVQYREVGSAEGEKTQQMVSIRQAIISGLTPSTEYAVSVATVNNVDTGGYSDEVIQQTTGDHIRIYTITIVLCDKVCCVFTYI